MAAVAELTQLQYLALPACKATRPGLSSAAFAELAPMTQLVALAVRSHMRIEDGHLHVTTNLPHAPFG